MATVYTSVGETVVCDLIDGTSATHLDNTNAKIGWGTGAGAAAKGDTTLFTEASEARVAVTTSQPTAVGIATLTRATVLSQTLIATAVGVATLVAQVIEGTGGGAFPKLVTGFLRRRFGRRF